MKSIRNSAKAILIVNHQILTIQLQDSEGEYYLLPGGGQEPGETLHEALHRECREEANAVIQIGQLRFVREYISNTHEFARQEPDVHQVEFMFQCELLNYSNIENGHLPDNNQLALKWIDLDKLLDYRLYPLSLRPYLQEIDLSPAPIYLGDIN